MWIHAESVAAELLRRLPALLEDCRSGSSPQLESSFAWGDTDYSVGAAVALREAPAAAGARRVTVHPRAWVVAHALVPGREPERTPVRDFHGGDDVAWLLCHLAGGRDLAAHDDGPCFVLDLAATAEAQAALAPGAEDLAAWRGRRCTCARVAGLTDACEGPPDVVRVAHDGTVTPGCGHHAIGLLERERSARAETGTTAGYGRAALEEALRVVRDSAEYRRRAASRAAADPPPADLAAATRPARRPWWRRLGS